MANDFEKVQELLRMKAELQARLSLIPYDGSVEIKEISDKKYLYIRRSEIGKRSSIYVGPYSSELHQVLLKGTKEAKEIKKGIRKTEKELTLLGYAPKELDLKVALNLDFARANIKSVIYDQAVLEGIDTTFPDTELIIENGKVNNVSAMDVQKILNLKHAWEFVLDEDVIQAKTNYDVCCYIAKLVNEGFYRDGGRIRAIPVSIGDSSYYPPLPIEPVVKEKIEFIVSSSEDAVTTAIELALFVMKTQIFNDGNKRIAIIFANHYLIAHGGGLMVVPENLVPEFKRLLVEYYENADSESVKVFMREKCLKKLS